MVWWFPWGLEGWNRQPVGTQKTKRLIDAGLGS
jgi:hypothetical protein